MTPSHKHLEWVPKPFRDGDLAGGGSSRLLGRSDLSATEILLREMAQNAWDARVEGCVPSFDVSLRTLSLRETAILRRELGGSHGLGLDLVLAEDRLRVLEISDRGTTGLDGPVEIGRVTGADTQNFVDLILKVGVPRTDGRGGGTYGFGKTAAYAYSSCGTVVYWTRCRTPEGLEHRLIASAMGPEFHLDGQEYTGRHWWGVRTGDGRTRPLTGPLAEDLGRSTFASRFDEEQTGTSILIIDPPVEHLVALSGRHDQDEEEFISDGGSSGASKVHDAFSRNARDALRLHLWPKMTPDTPGGPAPMSIDLRVEGSDVDLGSPEKGAWRFWAEALRAIRRDADGSAAPGQGSSGPPVKVIPVTGTRRRTRLGTLAIAFRHLGIDPASDADNLDPHSDLQATGRVMMMRGRTELIVRDKDEAAGIELLGSDWLAVFRADSGIDADLASTEPPAHNDWLPGGGETEGENYARAIRRRIPVLIREALSDRAPAEVRAETADATPLAAMLGLLLPDEPRSSSATASRERTGRSGGRSGFAVTGHRLLREGDRLHQRHMIDFITNGPEGSSRVGLSAKVASDESGASLSLDAEQLALQWRGAMPDPENQLLATVENGRAASVVLRTPMGRAIDVSISPVRD